MGGGGAGARSEAARAQRWRRRSRAARMHAAGRPLPATAPPHRAAQAGAPAGVGGAGGGVDGLALDGQLAPAGRQAGGVDGQLAVEGAGVVLQHGARLVCVWGGGGRAARAGGVSLCTPWQWARPCRRLPPGGKSRKRTTPRPSQPRARVPSGLTLVRVHVDLGHVARHLDGRRRAARNVGPGPPQAAHRQLGRAPQGRGGVVGACSGRRGVEVGVELGGQARGWEATQPPSCAAGARHSAGGQAAAAHPSPSRCRAAR